MVFANNNENVYHWFMQVYARKKRVGFASGTASGYKLRGTTASARYPFRL